MARDALSSTEATAPDLTVVICTHNRVALLERALASLNDARRPRDALVDVLVVPNACRDETHAALAGYQARAQEHGLLPVRFEPEPRVGKSHALNRAIRLVRAPLIAYVDDDHRVDAQFLVSILQAARSHPDTEIFCGRILPDWDGSEPGWVHDAGQYRIYPLPVPRYDHGPIAGTLSGERGLPGGGNVFLRRRLFSRIGGFSVDFGPRGHDLGGGEDTEWLERALASGATIRYEPSVVQYHYVDGTRLTLPYVLRKAYERSSSVMRLNRANQREKAVRGFMFRKLVEYVLQLVASRNESARRFFLVRVAAALGELDGALRRSRGD